MIDANPLSCHLMYLEGNYCYRISAIATRGLWDFGVLVFVTYLETCMVTSVRLPVSQKLRILPSKLEISRGYCPKKSWQEQLGVNN